MVNIIKMSKKVKNGKKLPEMVKNGQTWSNWTKWPS